MEYLGYELTPELSEEAFQRDREELLEAFDPRYVSIDELDPPAGCLGQFLVTVLHPTYILTSPEATEPEPVDELSFMARVHNHYPAIAPQLFFLPDCRLAHVNTYRSGTQCIDIWGKYSSLKNVVEKTIRAIIYDENVTKYNSMACSCIEDWQKEMARKGAFPLLDPPDLILRANTAPTRTDQLPPPLPGQFPVGEPARGPVPPPLPGRG